MVSQLEEVQTTIEISDREDKLLKKLWELHDPLCGYALAEKVWGQLLTDEERAQWNLPTTECNKPGRVAVLYAQVKNISLEASVIELWRNHDLPDIEYNWLCRELFHFTGERLGPLSLDSSTCNQFMWNSETGILKYQGKQIRKVKTSKDSKNIRRVLDVFQEDGWPEQVDNPFPGNPDKAQVKDTIRSLNSGLSIICFKSTESGSIIYRKYL